MAEEEIQAKRREREEEMANLEERLKDLDATRRTTEHQQEQFAQAVRKYKQDQYQVRYDLSTFIHSLSHSVWTRQSNL